VDKVLHAPCHSASCRFAQTELAILAHPDLTGGETRVYSALAAHRNQKTGLAWPSRQTLAGITGYHPDYISRTCSKLAGLGLIERQQDGRGRGRTTRFRFPLVDARKAGPNPHGDSVKPDPAISFSAATPYREEQINPTAADFAPPPPSPPPVPTEASRSDFSLALDGIPDLLIPAILAGLRGLGRATRQLLVDELVGRMTTGTVRRPVGYLAWLRQQHEAGTLIPEHAPRIAAERHRRQVIAVNIERASRYPEGPPGSSPTRENPSGPTDIAAKIAALRRALH